MAKGRSLLPYISDKQTFKAVQFALKLKEQMAYGLAIYKSSRYYGVPTSEIAHYLGKLGSGVKEYRKKNNA